MAFLSLTYGSGTNAYLNNYAITNGPTIGAGVNLSGFGLPGLDSDFAGTNRGSVWSIGAYQY